MPDKEDPQKQIPVEPKFFLGEDAPKLPGLTSDERRGLAASYVTGQDNPWFAKAFVNRVWYTLMGEAFYSPVDDIGPDREGARRPRSSTPLAAEWQKGGYDIHWLFRTILNTRPTSARSARPSPPSGRTPFAVELPEPAPLRPDPRLARPGPRASRVEAAAAAAGRGKAAGKAQARRPAKNGGAGLTKDLVATDGEAKEDGPAASGPSSTRSSASIRRPPTTTSWARSRRPSS